MTIAEKQAAVRSAESVLIAQLEAKVEDLSLRLARVESLVGGRNKSAATKRNMTDMDALEVLTGKFRELGHKEAAEASGLTYAQVYSCRCEFTFKHVHKDLRGAKWKNPWARPEGEHRTR